MGDDSWSRRDLRNEAIDRGLVEKGPASFKLTRGSLRDVLSAPEWARERAGEILYGLDGLEPYPGKPDVDVRYPLTAGRKLELLARIAKALAEERARDSGEDV